MSVQQQREPSQWSKLTATTKGAIIGASMVVGAVTGSLWELSTPSSTPVHESSSCQQHVFAGRAGYVPSCTWNDSGDRAARQVVGRSFTGCVVGWVSKGGPWGCLYGGIGGALSVIPW